jgi:replication factor C subunit 3/5
VGDVLREQTPKQLYVVRGKLYELLTNCIPPEVIFRTLTVELLRKLDDELRHKVWHLKLLIMLALYGWFHC